MSQFSSVNWLRSRFGIETQQQAYERLRTRSSDSSSLAGLDIADASGFEMEASRQSYGSDSSVIDQALLQNDELRSLLGVAPEKKPELPGPHMCSICCSIFSVMGAAFLVRARTLL